MSTLRLGLAALAIACTASVAAAQTTAPADTTTTPPANTPATPPADMPATPPADTTATPPANTATDTAKTDPAMTMNKTDADSSTKPPLSGANSFTEGQARDRITKAGFEDVQQLKKDDQGVWRGQAKKSGQQVGVALDYRGNIVQQ